MAGDDRSAVVVRHLTSDLAEAEDFREAYRAEARLLSRLESPHIVGLVEYVESDEDCAVVTETVEGVTLRAILGEQEEGRISPWAALCIFKDSLSALADAHGAGLLHRDYRPDNVLVTADGVALVTGFGVAARSGDVALAAQTPLYAAPERFHGTPASPSADLYAATVALFECVTGARPYTGTTAIELMAQHSFGDIPDEAAPEGVRPLIRAGLAAEPAERPASAREFLAELESVAAAGYGDGWEADGRRELVALVAFVAQENAAQENAAQENAADGETIEVVADGAVWKRQAKRRSVQMSVVAFVAAAAATALAVSATHSGHAATAGAVSSAAAPAPGSSAQPATTAFSAATPGASLQPMTGGGMPVAGVGTPSASAAEPSGSTTGESSSAFSVVSSQSPGSTAAPVISSLQISSLTCGTATPSLDAIVAVQSNGQGGDVIFSWFYQDTILSPRTYIGAPAKVALKPGETRQLVGPSAPEDYTAHAGATFWGVAVTSDPAAPSGAQAETLKVGSGCFL